MLGWMCQFQTELYFGWIIDRYVNLCTYKTLGCYTRKLTAFLVMCDETIIGILLMMLALWRNCILLREVQLEDQAVYYRHCAPRDAKEQSCRQVIGYITTSMALQQKNLPVFFTSRRPTEGKQTSLFKNWWQKAALMLGELSSYNS